MNYFNRLVLIFSLGVATFILLSKKECEIPTANNLESFIQTHYGSLSGFGISSEDSNNIQQGGGAPTYGEITYEGAQQLLDYLKPTKDDRFVDAGSGIGKLTVQTFYATPVQQALGIELSKERCDKACQILQSLHDKKLLPTNRTLAFKHQNILEADLTGTTIFFMCSTCFSDELMEKIMKKLEQLKPGLRVVTLRKLPDSNKFSLLTTLHLPMTWSQNVPVYIYKLL